MEIRIRPQKGHPQTGPEAGVGLEKVSPLASPRSAIPAVCWAFIWHMFLQA